MLSCPTQKTSFCLAVPHKRYFFVSQSHTKDNFLQSCPTQKTKILLTCSTQVSGKRSSQFSAVFNTTESAFYDAPTGQADSQLKKRTPLCAKRPVLTWTSGCQWLWLGLAVVHAVYFHGSKLKPKNSFVLWKFHNNCWRKRKKEKNQTKSQRSMLY